MELAGTSIKVSFVDRGLVFTELHFGSAVHKGKSDVSHPLLPEDVVMAVRSILEQPGHVDVLNITFVLGNRKAERIQKPYRMPGTSVESMGI